MKIISNFLILIKINNIDKKNSIKIKKRNTDILLENKGRNIDKKSKTKNYSTLKKFINNRKKKIKG